jgi:hypothetical protein
VPDADVTNKKQESGHLPHFGQGGDKQAASSEQTGVDLTAT